jgi:accessory gene regulator protein AgrB
MEVDSKMSFPSQIPEKWPVVTPEAVVIGIIVFVIVTFITYYITQSRWSWLPGIVFGVIAAIAVTPSTAQLISILHIVMPR